MKSLDLFRRKIRLPRGKHNDYHFGLSRIENSLLAFAILTLVVVGIMSSLKLPNKQINNTLSATPQSQPESLQTNTLTLYTDIKDSSTLNDIKTKLVQLGYKVNLTGRSSIEANTIYYPKSDQASAQMISETLARSFDMHESVSATATGFVIYLKE